MFTLHILMKFLYFIFIRILNLTKESSTGHRHCKLLLYLKRKEDDRTHELE